MADDEPRPMTRREAAEFLGVHVNTVTIYVGRGMLHPTGTGKWQRFYLPDLRDFLARYGNESEAVRCDG